jgi:hypothetical protein
MQRTPPRGVSNFPEDASSRVTTLHEAAAGVRFRIVSSEAVDSADAYVRLFHQALAESGIAANGVFQARTGWLDDHQEEFDAVHFHYPEWIVRRDARWGSTALPSQGRVAPAPPSPAADAGRQSPEAQGVPA